jgi:uncharacterized membrane protein YbaN (DUF454 family)
MYTLLTILGFIGLIASGLGVLFWVIINTFIWFEAVDRLSEYRKSGSYSTNSDVEQEEVRAAKAKRKLIYSWVFILVLLFSFTTISFADHQLSREKCQTNGGKWVSWDLGMQWDCFNPDLIPEDRNSRIILEDGE